MNNIEISIITGKISSSIFRIGLNKAMVTIQSGDLPISSLLVRRWNLGIT